MKFLLSAVVALCLCTVTFAGDVSVTASGFPQNHRGNGTFVMKQVINNGKPLNCWTQNADNDGWIMSLTESGILTVTYCRNGAPQVVYRKTGTDLSAQEVGLATSVIGNSVPRSVSINP